MGQVRNAYSYQNQNGTGQFLGDLGTDKSAKLKETVRNDMDFVHLAQDRDW